MIPLSKLVNRDGFPAWLEANGITGEGVEIGTYYGLYAEQICKGWSGKLTTVDPYNWEADPAYIDGCKIDWSTEDKRQLSARSVHKEAAHRLAQYDRCEMVNASSLLASSYVEESSLAFVYLDGNHSLEAVMADIAAWWPKIRSGGLLCGHDAYDRDDELQKCGVATAVWNFSEQIGIRPHITHCTSWWIIKP